MRSRKKKGGMSISPLMASGAGVGCDGTGRRRRAKRGSGWWEDLSGWVNTHVKKPQYVSKGLKAYGAVDPSLWGQAAGLAGNVAESFGWGKGGKRRRRTR